MSRPIFRPSATTQTPVLQRGWAGVFLLSCFAVVLTGCGMGGVVSGPTPGTVTPGAKGVIHGGQNPVGNSAVSLMAVGTAGYGSAPVELSTTTSAPVTGLFTLPSHVCPTPDSLVYVEAVGGDSGTGTNSAIHLAAVLGKCSTVSAATEVDIDEVTTVAAAYALAPFAKLSTLNGLGIGTSATNITGLNNVAGPANNLVDFTTGLARGTNDVAGMVLPTPLMNTLADILAACVNTGNSASTSCLFLDTNTTVNGFVPSDTFEAAISIAQNPGANVTNLLTLSSSTAPFQPTIAASTPPQDFSLAIGYNGSGIATYGAIDVAIDSVGNAWITTFNTTPTLAGLIEITPTGGYPGGAAGFGTTVLAGSVGIDVDQNGLIWVNNANDQQLAAFHPDGSFYASFDNSGDPNGQGIDANGDIWTSAGGTGEDNFQELVKGSGSNYTAGTVYTGASYFGTGICITKDYLFEVAAGIPSQGVGPGVAVLDLSTQAQTAIYPEETAIFSGCAVDHAGNLYVPDNGQIFSGIEVYNAQGALLNSFPMPSPNADYQYFGPQEMAIDGLGNSFLAAYVYDANSGGNTNFPATIAEFSSTGVQIGPMYGYAPTAGVSYPPNPNNNTGLMGLVSPLVTDPGGVAVDGSGNLWLSGVGAGGVPGYVTEVIGIAAPVVTPKAVALTNGTIATRP
jgi:hypothetical protein